MYYAIVASLLLLVSYPSLAYQEDKVKHLAAGVIISNAVQQQTGSWWTGFAAGCGAGLAKEVYDGNGRFSTKDLLATCLGATLQLRIQW